MKLYRTQPSRIVRASQVFLAVVLCGSLAGHAAESPASNAPQVEAKEKLAAAQPPRSTTSARKEAPRALGLSQGAQLACQKRVGIFGSYFDTDMHSFLVSHGLTVTLETAATVVSSLSSLDVLYLNRNASVTAPIASAIEAWVRGGGTLITEFDATQLLFNGTFGFFQTATLDDSFGVPSGSVCGSNSINVTSPANSLATGLPAMWPCSGDPIGVFKVYKESTVDPLIDRVARNNSDLNNDGAKDLVVGTACVDDGVVVSFFTDFGDWQPLENPRNCSSGASCQRSIEDETLMLNAVCRVQSNCVKDHFLCYKVRPNTQFKTRKVLIRNQFGGQRFTVLQPDLLCVPSTKKVLP